MVDDSEDDFRLASRMLQSVGRDRFSVEWAASYDAGLQALARREHDVCLLDHALAGRTALEFLEEARSRGFEVPTILLTGNATPEIDREAMKAGATDFLVKDKVDGASLERAVRYALEHARHRQALRSSRDDLLAILNRLRVGSVLTDEQGQVVFVSEACQPLIDARGLEGGRAWQELWPLEAEVLKELEQVVAAEPLARARVSARIAGRGQRGFWVEFEVHDDPRDARRKIFFLYDVTEVKDLRRLLLDEKGRFQDLIGKSEGMTRVYQMIRDLAPVDTTVLINGETGTGKELVARAIHNTSARSGKRFVAVNAAGLTESLLASQLFGHRRGAFTGAVEDHRGLFEAADGGTLFLDEVGDIAPSVQTSLLRVLQEREILRVGETTPRKVNVRVLAATNRDLEAEVEKGTFRLDLLYRLRVVQLRIPPLRERREDIPLLAEAFLRKLRAAVGKEIGEIGNDVLRLLLEQPWRGNVRELESVIECAVIRCKGSVLQLEDLPEELFRPQAERRSLLPASSPADERQLVLDALTTARGNRSAAARLLGVSRATFYRRLTDLNILGGDKAARAEEAPRGEEAARGEEAGRAG
jgi:DNA-binding NtrC family response regulator